ncbi:MAG: diguanylate cyclase [Methyloprofundus sp.]|nr:diguanylate cyclase [Methyloprofundus sp.]
MKNISIRGLALQYITSMLVPVVLVTLVCFFLLYEELYERQQQEHQNKAMLIADNISQLVVFYNEIAKDLAKQAQLIDLIKHNKVEAAQQWSVKTRSLLPYSNGLALLSLDQKVIGNSKVQKIGKLCFRDLLLKFAGKLEVIPPIHHPDGKLSHFDIVVPVYEDEQVIGVLFASFSLELIQRVLERVQLGNESLLIETEQSVKVAEVGSPTLDFSLLKTAIPETNWLLRSEVPKFELEAFIIKYIPAALLLLLILAGLTSLFVMHLGKVIVADILGIKQALLAVHKGEFTSSNQESTRLKETNEIVGQVRELAHDIYIYQQQLLTLSSQDDLTHLNNRRTFFNDYKNYQALIKRGSTCALLLFDLDNFKYFNDNFGHNFGDEILLEFARILQNTFGNSHCARLGGDEFVAIQVDCSRQEIEAMYQDIVVALAPKNKAWQAALEVDVQIASSVGGVFITHDNIAIEKAIEQADKALYTAKDLGRGRLKFAPESL